MAESLILLENKSYRQDERLTKGSPLGLIKVGLSPSKQLASMEAL